MSNLTQTFSNRLRAAMDADGRQRCVIAAKAGYSASYIRAVKNPTLTFVETMADTLGVPVTDLLQ